MSNDAGKGSRYRPIDREKWDKGYERIFGKKKTFFDTIFELDEVLVEANREVNQNDNTAISG